MLRGVFTLNERRAGEVMTPRTRMTAMREGQTVRGALAATRDTGHSRFPLLDRRGAQLLGVVYGRELTEALLGICPPASSAELESSFCPLPASKAKKKASPAPFFSGNRNLWSRFRLASPT
jgi:CBS domain containing-hemolysin-like protein